MASSIFMKRIARRSPTTRAKSWSRPCGTKNRGGSSTTSSLEISLMLNRAFDDVGGDAQVDLYPATLRSEIDVLNSRIKRFVATGVYAVAAARDQAEYDGATKELFGFLDERENSLADGRGFLLGEQATLADILIFTPLVRFDAVYNPLFRASRKRLVDYPQLTRLVKRILRPAWRGRHRAARPHPDPLLRWGLGCCEPSRDRPSHAHDKLDHFGAQHTRLGSTSNQAAGGEPQPMKMAR